MRVLDLFEDVSVDELRAQLRKAEAEYADMGSDQLGLASEAQADALDSQRSKIQQLKNQIAAMDGVQEGHQYSPNTPMLKYEELSDEIQQSLTTLNAKLQEHQQKFSNDARNWGYVGDLEYIASTLKKIEGFMS